VPAVPLAHAHGVCVQLLVQVIKQANSLAAQQKQAQCKKGFSSDAVRMAYVLGSLSRSSSRPIAWQHSKSKCTTAAGSNNVEGGHTWQFSRSISAPIAGKGNQR
jgi:hypothetical protein